MRSTRRVATPPTVSMDRLSGVTSKSRMLLSAFTRPVDVPDSVAPWIAAPMATHSSGLMDADGSLPVSLRTWS